MTGRRARLTPVDVVYLAVSFAVLAFGIQIFYPLLNQNAGRLGTGELYLFQTIAPALLLTLFTVLFVTAVGGSSS